MDYWKILELVGTIIGLIYLYFEYKADKLVWVAGIIMPAIYIVVCYNAGIYADFAINIYYFLAAIYGWFMWNNGISNKNKEERPVSLCPKKNYIPIIIISFLLYFLIGFVLVKFTNSNVPWCDSLTTSLSIVGMWMLAKKYAEQWILWIIVDAASVFLYIYKGLYFTSVLYFIYTVISFTGYFKWKAMAKEIAIKK